MIPIQFYQFGKPEVIKPENLGTLEKQTAELEFFFTHQDDLAAF